MSSSFASRVLIRLLLVCGSVFAPALATAQEDSAGAFRFGPYEYESKPDDPVFNKFNPRLAPPPGPLLLRKGDRLAIIGDSITEQKQYSRIIETYLTACVPQLEVTARQYGWSGERAEGFLRRMDQDCLRFHPTIATLAYGMNDSRYRPFDINNGNWYRDHYNAVVQKLKDSGARVVVGSPGCAGKIASWVKSRNGTLDEHNLNLCALRDIALQIAESQDVAFADIFWPMYTNQIMAAKRYGRAGNPYEVAGQDGIHPGGAGHLIMAYAFLRSMGLDGAIGEYRVDMSSGQANASEGHVVDGFADGILSLTSTRYPFCAEGPLDDHNSIRSGMTLVPFSEQLNRLILRVVGMETDRARVTWGDHSKEFARDALESGINLAEEFPQNPFSRAFEKVDQAVAAKQAFETHQIKRVFHGKEGKQDIESAVKRTEAERQPLADAIAQSVKPVTHRLQIEPVE